jgi:hypothetical protein
MNEEHFDLGQTIIGIMPYLALVISLPMLITHNVPPGSHDIVLAIVSGLIGAIVSPKATSAIKRLHKPKADPAPQPKDKK